MQYLDNKAVEPVEAIEGGAYQIPMFPLDPPLTLGY